MSYIVLCVCVRVLNGLVSVALVLIFFPITMRPKPKCAICKHLINMKNDERPLYQVQDKAIYKVLAAKDEADTLRVHWNCARYPHRHGWNKVGSIEVKHDCNICYTSMCLLYNA